MDKNVPTSSAGVADYINSPFCIPPLSCLPSWENVFSPVDQILGHLVWAASVKPYPHPTWPICISLIILRESE